MKEEKPNTNQGYIDAFLSLGNQATPALVARIIELISDSAGTAMLNLLGGRAAASVLYIITGTALLRGVPSVGLSFAGNIAAGESKQKEDVSYNPTNVGKILRAGMLLTPLLAVPFIGLGLSAEPLIKLIHKDGSIAAIVQQYFLGYCAVLIPSLWVTLNNALLNGIGKGWAVVGFTLLNRAVMLSVTAALLFGLNFGVVSLAVGYGAGAVAALLAMFIYQRYNHSFQDFGIFQWSFSGFWTHAKSILDKGSAKSGYAFAELGSKVYLSFIIGLLGDKALCASQPAFQFSGVVTNLVFAFAMGSSFSVSKKIAENEKDYAIKIGNVTIVSSLIATAFLFLLSIAIGPFMNYPFYGENSYFSMPHILLMISLFSQLFDTLRNTSAACGATGLAPKLGASMTQVPMLYNYLGIIFGILPLAYFLSQKTPLAEAGAFVAQGVSMAITGFFMARFWHRMQGQLDKVKDSQEEEKDEKKENKGISFFSALRLSCLPQWMTEQDEEELPLLANQ